jgi:hypothetical protein
MLCIVARNSWYRGSALATGSWAENGILGGLKDRAGVRSDPGRGQVDGKRAMFPLAGPVWWCANPRDGDDTLTWIALGLQRPVAPHSSNQLCRRFRKSTVVSIRGCTKRGLPSCSM